MPFSTRFHISLYAMSSKTKLTHKVYEKVSWREQIKPKNKWLKCNRYIEKDKMVKLQNTSAFRIEYNKNEKKIDIRRKKKETKRRECLSSFTYLLLVMFICSNGMKYRNLSTNMENTILEAISTHFMYENVWFFGWIYKNSIHKIEIKLAGEHRSTFLQTQFTFYVQFFGIRLKRKNKVITKMIAVSLQKMKLFIFLAYFG